MRKHNALARRLIDRQDDYLRFTHDTRIPADNNEARHPHGQAQPEGLRLPAHHDRPRQFCAIRSYLSTAAKHGLTFFDALVMLTQGQPWMPAI